MKKPGRPRIDPDDESTQLCLTLPNKEFDRLYALAQRERTTVPDIIRQKLRRDDDPPRDS